jgi:hypothetical protein
MLANRFIDPDIIDHPELANIYPGFGTIDADGNGYLAVPVQEPDAARGKGRRSFGETQRRIQETMSAWGVRAAQVARAAGRTAEETTQELEKHAVIAVSSVRTLGSRACPPVFGVTASELETRLRQQVDNLRTTKGQEAVDTLVRSEFATFYRLGRVHLRSRAFDMRLYEAFHGRLAGSFHDKMAVALNPRVEEARFPLPEAAHLSLVTGVNLAFLWQDQWHYRLLLGAAAALYPWAQGKPADILPEELYTLLRCVQTVDPNDPTEHGETKRFLVSLIYRYQGRAHFLTHATDALRDAKVLTPDHPRNVAELMRRCITFVDDAGEPESFEVSVR